KIYSCSSAVLLDAQRLQPHWLADPVEAVNGAARPSWVPFSHLALPFSAIWTRSRTRALPCAERLSPNSLPWVPGFSQARENAPALPIVGTSHESMRVQHVQAHILPVTSPT